jgi:hypothetical protein
MIRKLKKEFEVKIAGLVLLIGLLGSNSGLFANGDDSDDHMYGLMVTRHFTGAWDQPDQEAQGLTLEVIEQADDSRKAVAYWYTYGSDRKTAWYLGIGNLIEDRIEFTLHDSTNVGFMQDNLPGNDSVQAIGSMTIVFDDCDSGIVTFDTDHEEVGSGSFRIQRVSSIMNTHCSGGISDDMHADGGFGEEYLALLPAREGINGEGQAKFERSPGHMQFEVEVKDLPDGEHRFYVGLTERGTFDVDDGRGKIEFASPHETGKHMMNFDPRGEVIEVHDQHGAVLSSFEGSFDETDHGHHGNGDGERDYDCDRGMNGGGGHMGGGMDDCVDDGDYIEIEADLNNTGVLADAEGEAEWEMNSSRVEFSVEIEDVPPGSYTLKVGGEEVGIIRAYERHNGGVFGLIRFRDPERYGMEPLDFDPRGQKVEVLQGENVILEVEFPTE